LIRLNVHPTQLGIIITAMIGTATIVVSYLQRVDDD
jgi:hypothetical protein